MTAPAPMKPTEMWAVVNDSGALQEISVMESWARVRRDVHHPRSRVVRVLVTEVPRPDGKEGG